MKILFISYVYWPPDFGGELLISIERLETLAQRGHRILILTSGKSGFPRQEKRQDFTILRSPVIGNTRLARILRRIVFTVWVWMLLLIQNYQAVHWLALPGINLASDAVISWIIGWLAHRRDARVITVHSLAEQEQDTLVIHGMHGFWRRLLLAQVDHIVAVSPALFRPLETYFPRKAILIINGVRDDIFVPLNGTDRNTFRQQKEISSSEVVFSFLGTVGRRKGFDVLAEAFADLASVHSDWRLWVIGPRTPEENQNLNLEEVKAVCRPLEDCEAQVIYWGRIDDRPHLAQILATSDVFVFPSRREGMGLAPVEAMSSGVPVIISRLPDITDLASIDEQTGLYTEPGNVEQLKEAMRRLGENQMSREQMSQAARQRVEDGFSWEEHISRWEKLYMYGE